MSRVQTDSVQATHAPHVGEEVRVGHLPREVPEVVVLPLVELGVGQVVLAVVDAVRSNGRPSGSRQRSQPKPTVAALTRTPAPARAGAARPRCTARAASSIPCR